MNTGRRSFLRRLATGVVGAAVASAIDPELLAWEPGKKTYFLPTERQKLVYGVDWSKGVDFTSVVRMRLVRKFDKSDRAPMRMDALYGFSTIQPRLSAEVLEDDYNTPATKRILDEAAKSLADKIDRDIMNAWKASVDAGTTVLKLADVERQAREWLGLEALPETVRVSKPMRFHPGAFKFVTEALS